MIKAGYKINHKTGRYIKIGGKTDKLLKNDSLQKKNDTMPFHRYDIKTLITIDYRDELLPDHLKVIDQFFSTQSKIMKKSPMLEKLWDQFPELRATDIPYIQTKFNKPIREADFFHLVTELKEVNYGVIVIDIIHADNDTTILILEGY